MSLKVYFMVVPLNEMRSYVSLKVSVSFYAHCKKCTSAAKHPPALKKMLQYMMMAFPAIALPLQKIIDLCCS